MRIAIFGGIILTGKLGSSTGKSPSVAIIIVHWKGIDLTLSCLESLQSISYPNFQIYLVDNGSSDQIGSLIAQRFPNITLLESGSNLGFTGGNNLGLHAVLKGAYEYVLLLNNDTIVTPNFLHILVDVSTQNPRLAMVQPLIFFEEDRQLIWSAGGTFLPWLAISKTVGYHQSRSRLDGAKGGKLDWATGCCVLIRCQALREVGLLREVFFAYFEDVDLSLRLKRKGWEIELAQNALIYHKVAGSSKNQSKEGTISPTVIYLTVRNQMFQIKLHVKGFLPTILAYSYQGAKFFSWFVYFCLRARFNKSKAVLHGLKDGIRIDPSIDRPLPPRNF